MDRGYADPRLASLYDAECPWHPQDDFYQALDLAAESVLDMACGTGSRLVSTRSQGHRGRLVGVDPAPGMLAVARSKSNDVEWVYGDAQSVSLEERFGLITMTGHAFQCLLTDADVRAALATFRHHVEANGLVAFESRHPDARGWETWTAAASRSRIVGPDGTAYDVWVDLREVSGELVTFKAVTRDVGRGQEWTSTSTLRFLPPDRLRAMVEEAGFAVDGWYGDWDRSPVTATSPELIVLARPVRAGKSAGGAA